MKYKVGMICISMVSGILSFFEAEPIDKPTRKLLEAASDGSVSRLKRALESGARIEARDMDESTALNKAAWDGHLECLNVLLDHGAQIDSKGSFGATALIDVAANGYKDCMELLLERGAQIEAKNNFGETALHRIAANGHLECLKVLLLAAAHVAIDGPRFKFFAPAKNNVELSRRRLKVSLLALRYAGSNSDEPKSKNEAGDHIVSDAYIGPWFLLSHTGLREDVCTVLRSFLVTGKNVNYPLFRMAQHELADYLLLKLRDFLRKITVSRPIASVVGNLSAAEQAEVIKLCDPDLVEENFGALIRSGIKARFNELLKTDSQVSAPAPQNFSASSSTSLAKEQITKKERIDDDAA